MEDDKVLFMLWCVEWLKRRGCKIEFWYEYDKEVNEVNIRYRGSSDEGWVEKVCDMNIMIKIKWEGDKVVMVGGGNVYDWDSEYGDLLINCFKRVNY